MPQIPRAEDAAAAGRLGARLDRLPATRTVWRLVALLSIGFFFELYDLLYSGYVAPGLVRARILDATTTGLFGMNGIAAFIASLFAGLFVGTLACGFLADRFGRRVIFTGSLLWYAAANAVMAMQDSAAGLDAWRFVAGLGIGVEMVTIGTYLSELAPKAIRGRAFAVCQAIGCTGALALWWLRRGLPESPRWLAERGRLAEAEAIVAALEERVRRESGAPLPEPGPAEAPVRRETFADMWVPPYRRRALMLIAFHVFQTVGFYGFANWVPTLLIQQGIRVTSSLLYTTLIGLAAPVGPLLGYAVADRFERKHVIVAVAAFDAVCGLLFSRASAPWAIIALGVGLTVANNVISFTYHAYQQELFPTGIRARAVGFVYAWSRFSAIFSSFVIAAILGGFGTSGVFLFIGGAMVVVMLVIGLLGPRTRGLGLEATSH